MQRRRQQRIHVRDVAQLPFEVEVAGVDGGALLLTVQA